MPNWSKTVLIVDDNRDVADTLAMVLQMKGYRSLVAYDAMTGYTTAERENPEVILHDIAMPHVDGYAAARRLRSNSRFDKTLLVAITAHDRTFDRVMSRNAGFDMHLSKPVDFETLDEILARR